MKVPVQILSTETRQGSYEGRAYTSHTAHCVLGAQVIKMSVDQPYPAGKYVLDISLRDRSRFSVDAVTPAQS